jgi:hypothetical protein
MQDHNKQYEVLTAFVYNAALNQLRLKRKPRTDESRYSQRLEFNYNPKSG